MGAHGGHDGLELADGVGGADARHYVLALPAPHAPHPERRQLLSNCLIASETTKSGEGGC